MTNLREKYAQQIASMIEDAKANVAEKESAVEERVSKVAACTEDVAVLENVANSAQRSLNNAASQLKRVGKRNAPGLGKIDEIADTCGTYTSMVRKMPEAENRLKEAEESLAVEKMALAKATEELEIISRLARI